MTERPTFLQYVVVTFVGLLTSGLSVGALYSVVQSVMGNL